MNPPPRSLFRLPRHSDERGHLVVVEAGADVPFEIRRTFWIFGNVLGLPRAAHAHARTTQMLVCVAGRCRVRLEWDTGSRDVLLAQPDDAVLVPPHTWVDLLEFTPDCVLLVLADRPYDPAGVIADRASIAGKATT